MTVPTKQQALTVFRSGTPAQRAEFLSRLPANRFKDAASLLFASGEAAKIIQAIVLLLEDYWTRGNAEAVAILAEAARERALEIGDPGTSYALAIWHVNALALLGRPGEVVSAVDRFLPLHQGPETHPGVLDLKVKRFEALVDLKRFD